MIEFAMFRRCIIAAIVVIACLVSALSISGFRRGKDTGVLTVDQPIQVLRITPPESAENDVECPSFAEVDFTYRIVNCGEHSLFGLKLGTSCACEAVGNPPSEIPAGESALVSFRLKAPYVGRLQRRIPLLVEGNKEPLLVLDASLRVKFDPPALVPLPQDFTLSFVTGDDSSREFVVETIERTQSEPWLTGLELNPSGAFEVQQPQVDELNETDPRLMRRRYRFPFVNRSFDVGQHTATVTLRTRQDDAKTLPTISLKVAVVDSVAIVPNPLVIKFQPGSKPDVRRVHLVDRGSGQISVRGTKCDETILQVRAAAQQQGSAQAFEIVPLGTSEVSFNTPVVFDIGNGQTRELLVRFEPSAAP